MIRLGLCCLFTKEPFRFRQTTAKFLAQKSRIKQLHFLSQICLENVLQLEEALKWLVVKNIGAFRIPSSLFPRATHPLVGYSLDELPDSKGIRSVCERVRDFSKALDIRLSLHPDQFNVLSSPHDEVVKKSMKELEHQAELAELFGVEVINIHAGGAYGDTAAALCRFEKNFHLLSHQLRSRLTLENDDISYSPKTLLPLCQKLNVPFVYDIHHHRCLQDEISIEEATSMTVGLWEGLGREPYFHISSPKNGWRGDKLRAHADFIDPDDFPSCWKDVSATVDVEAKGKELAVLRLQQYLRDCIEKSQDFSQGLYGSRNTRCE